MLKFLHWKHLATLFCALLVAGCGGGSSGSAPAPTGFTVTPGNGQVTVSWNAQAGVQYWLMYAATGTPIDIKNPPSGHTWATDITSPYVVTGLTNGVTYSFAMNARTGGGPGGAQTASLSTSPRYAGANWSAGAAAGGNDLRGLAYGTASDASVDYVAVGSYSALYKGTDGNSWSAVTTGPSIQFKAATYAFSKFIGVGSAGVGNNVFYSADLANWTAASTGISTGLNAIASNGTTVVAVGDGGTVYYSTDGSNWTAAATTNTSANLYGVTYSSSSASWVAVGAGGALISSTNLSNWTALASNAAGQDLNAVTVTSANVFVAVGNGGTVVRSSDGVTWTPQTLGATLYAVSTDSVKFVAVGAGGAIYTSADGATWTAVSQTGSTADLMAVIGSVTKYVAVGKSGANLSSVN